MSVKLKKDKRLDVFQACLVKGAEFRGEYEIPLVGNTEVIPDLMLPFSIAISKNLRQSILKDILFTSLKTITSLSHLHETPNGI